MREKDVCKGSGGGGSSSQEHVTYKGMTPTRREKEVTQIKREKMRINPIVLDGN